MKLKICVLSYQVASLCILQQISMATISYCESYQNLAISLLLAIFSLSCCKECLYRYYYIPDCSFENKNLKAF